MGEEPLLSKSGKNALQHIHLKSAFAAMHAHQARQDALTAHQEKHAEIIIQTDALNGGMGSAASMAAQIMPAILLLQKKQTENHARQIQTALQATAYGMCAGHQALIAETATAIQENLATATAALLMHAQRCAQHAARGLKCAA